MKHVRKPRTRSISCITANHKQFMPGWTQDGASTERCTGTVPTIILVTMSSISVPLVGGWASLKVSDHINRAQEEFFSVGLTKQDSRISI